MTKDEILLLQPLVAVMACKGMVCRGKTVEDAFLTGETPSLRGLDYSPPASQRECLSSPIDRVTKPLPQIRDWSIKD